MGGWAVELAELAELAVFPEFWWCGGAANEGHGKFQRRLSLSV